MSDDTTEELGQLTGEERSVVIGALTITVKEVTMKNLKPFMVACAPFINEFEDGGRLATKKDAEGRELAVTPMALLQVLADHNEAFCTAAACVTNATVEVFERMKPDEFFKVAQLVVRVNGDFFVLRLAPQLIKFARAIGLVGVALSNS